MEPSAVAAAPTTSLCHFSTCVQNSIFSQIHVVHIVSHSQSCKPADESRPGALPSWLLVLALVLFDLELVRAAVAAV